MPQHIIAPPKAGQPITEGFLHRITEAANRNIGGSQNMLVLGHGTFIRQAARQTTVVKEGFLTGALDASTGNGTVEATAEMSVYGGTGADWADSGETETVTNRDDSLSAVSGTYIIVRKINGEWRPIWVAC